MNKIANILTAILLLAGCGGDNIEIVDPEGGSAEDSFVFTLSGTAVRLEQEGGSATVSLTSDKAWTASVSDDWFTVSALSGDSGITDLEHLLSGARRRPRVRDGPVRRALGGVVPVIVRQVGS